MRALDHHLLVRGDSALKFHFDDRSSDGFGLRLPAEGTPHQPLGQHLAHETAGAASTRRSLRPLFFGRNDMVQLGQIMPRECGRLAV